MLDIVKKNTEKPLPSFSERWRPLLSVVDRTACVPLHSTWYHHLYHRHLLFLSLQSKPSDQRGV